MAKYDFLLQGYKEQIVRRIMLGGTEYATQFTSAGHKDAGTVLARIFP